MDPETNLVGPLYTISPVNLKKKTYPTSRISKSTLTTSSTSHPWGPFNNKKSLLAHALITVLKMRGFPGATVMSSSAWRQRSLGREAGKNIHWFHHFFREAGKTPQCLKHSELS